jgi:hypothetical protein
MPYLPQLLPHDALSSRLDGHKAVAGKENARLGQFVLQRAPSSEAAKL